MAEIITTVPPPTPPGGGEGDVIYITELTTIGADGTAPPGIYTITKTPNLPRPTPEPDVSTTPVDSLIAEITTVESETFSGTQNGGALVVSAITSIGVIGGETGTIRGTTLQSPTPLPTPPDLLLDDQQSTAAGDNSTTTSGTIRDGASSGGKPTSAASQSNSDSDDWLAHTFPGPSRNSTTAATSTSRSMTSTTARHDVALQEGSSTLNASTTTTRGSTVNTTNRLKPIDTSRPDVLQDGSSSSTAGSGTVGSAGNGAAANPTDTNDQPLTQTYITNGITLTGSAAASAIAAAASKDDGTPTDSVGRGGSTLSSYAIVGIVAGSLVGLMVVYVIWYKWRKKRIRRSQGDELDDDPSDDPYARTEEKYGADPNVHSGFDLIDHPPSTPSTHPRGTDPFADYEEAYEPYLADHGSRPARPESDLEALDDHEADVDELGNALYSALPVSQRTRGKGEGVEWDPPNPFDPPTPPAPIPRRASDHAYTHTPAPRPLTHASRQSDGDIYDGYISSRPPSSLDPFGDHHPPIQTANIPATSKLLPWLHQAPSNTSAMPPSSNHPPKSRTDADHPSGDYAEADAYEKISETPAPVPVPPLARSGKIRHPPRAVMAGTPAPGGQGGFPDVIPNFR